MIEIDFKMEEYVLNKIKNKDITEFAGHDFTSTLLIMPVRFKANEVELFGFENNPWGSAPIMSMATEVFEIVKNLKTIKKDFYIFIEGPVDIGFTLIDDVNVKIDCDDGSDHVITVVNYVELYDAFNRYSNKVRDYLREKLPQMNQHPFWGPWIRGERDN